MDPENLPIENRLPLQSPPHENSSQDSEVHSQSSIIPNNESCSQAEQSPQLQEPLLIQLARFFLPLDLFLEGSKTTLTNVEEIDKRLGQKWFFIYDLWLSFVIVAAPLKGVFLAAFVQDFWLRRDYELANMCSVLLLFAFYHIFWTVRQARLHKEALRKKDQRIAAKAFNSVLGLAIYYFALCVAYLGVGIYWISYHSRYRRDWISELCYLSLQFLEYYVIPVGISVYGSYKVKSLLQEKTDLLLRSKNCSTNSSAHLMSQQSNVMLL